MLLTKISNSFKQQQSARLESEFLISVLLKSRTLKV